MLYLIIRLLALILFKIYCRLQVFGKRNVPQKGAVIIASNHRSYLDPPLIAAACPRPVFFLAKEELFRYFLFGRFIKALHASPLKSKSADLRALRWGIETLQEGKALVIFPEGRRVAEDQESIALSGIGFLAAKTGAAIIPTFIKGAKEAMPIRSKMVWPRKIKVYFGKAILAKDIKADAQMSSFYQAIAERTMREINRLKEQSNAKN